MCRNMLIANRLRNVFLDGHWIANTNYKEQLLTITWRKANQKVRDLNTISALTYHVNYYLSGLLEALETGELKIHDRLSYSVEPFDSEQSWKNLVSEFLRNCERFIEKVELLDNNDLDNIFLKDEYGTLLRNIEGVIEHSYYHLGQIVLINRMLQSPY